MTIRTETGAGIATLTIDHPPLNVLTRAVLRELREAATRLRDDAGVRVVVLAATGKNFSAGADVDVTASGSTAYTTTATFSAGIPTRGGITVAYSIAAAPSTPVGRQLLIAQAVNRSNTY